MSNYATQWYDPALEIGDDDSIQKIILEEGQRLAKLLAIAIAAGAIPRRMGQDSTRQEQSIDKKRSRRIAHVASQLLDSWVGSTGRQEPSQEITREAAIVDWPRWWDGHQIFLENRRTYIATWAQNGGCDPQWAKTALVKLNNELSWLAYALRD
jgi:hypothetical protein